MLQFDIGLFDQCHLFNLRVQLVPDLQQFLLKRFATLQDDLMFSQLTIILKLPVLVGLLERRYFLLNLGKLVDISLLFMP